MKKQDHVREQGEVDPIRRALFVHGEATTVRHFNGGLLGEYPVVDGAIVVDKPGGWTSHDVVGKMRRIANTKKIGHLGTLDPIATGVLPLVIGRATRLAQFYTRSDKIYEGVVRFGWSTSTYDRAGEATSPQVEYTVDPAALEAAMDAFRGPILQTPPAVSAKKVDGRRAYELARASVAVALEPVR